MLSEADSNPDIAPNTVTYNSLLDCCVRCFDMPLAQRLFEDMRAGRAKAKPDLITYSTLIKGFCRQRNLEQALTLVQ